MSAKDELKAFLKPDEIIEAVVFGPWGWDGYEEPEPPPVPEDMRGKVLSWTDAAPLMHGWEFNTGYGAPNTYAVCVWTNRHVIFVSQYDGATWLHRVPRHPIEHIPDMPGGG